MSRPALLAEGYSLPDTANETQDATAKSNSPGPKSKPGSSPDAETSLGPDRPPESLRKRGQESEAAEQALLVLARLEKPPGSKARRQPANTNSSVKNFWAFFVPCLDSPAAAAQDKSGVITTA